MSGDILLTSRSVVAITQSFSGRWASVTGLEHLISQALSQKSAHNVDF